MSAKVALHTKLSRDIRRKGAVVSRVGKGK